MTERADPLRALLGADLPGAVQELPDDVRARLAAQIEAARRHQDKLIADAVEVAIAGVPLPVRGVVKKTLRG